MGYIEKTIRVPCAVTWEKRPVFRILIDRDHPHAEELRAVADELMTVNYLDDDNWKVDRLTKRVEEVAGKDASNQMMMAWQYAARKNKEAEWTRNAWQWWNSVKPANMSIYNWIDGLDMLGEDTYGIILALYSIVKENFNDENNEALIALFLYGYQRGQQAGNAKEATV